MEFSEEAIGYLEEQGFDLDFLEYLAGFEFTGDVRAVPEGTPVFPDEPLVEVTAPVIQAQLLETMLINQISFQSLIATKAARMRDIVDRNNGDQPLVDFGSRRAHGTDAGMKAARASYIGGFAGTSNVAAGQKFGIPVFGTMAHSWIESFPTEKEAFEAYLDIYGEESILLVDTYDTLKGAELARDLCEERKLDIKGVRIDSGDLAELSKKVDSRTGLGVFVSSGLDEYKLKDFFERGGISAGFGVGTNLVTSSDAPKIEGVYKLVEVEREGRMQPVMKLSKGKSTFPGKKSVRRVFDNGSMRKDFLGLEGEDLDGEEILVDVFREGKLVYDAPYLEEIREKAIASLESVPLKYRRIEDPEHYPVNVGTELEEQKESLEEELESR
ncbi:MAG: nicotinate phosphoribosyltransferase [Candidatus Nanohaloarchaea archaeon]|nr:nicotinate phosphoribosyltransferase [Candidatus Nanohaloarchaea archaeon]